MPKSKGGNVMAMSPVFPGEEAIPYTGEERVKNKDGNELSALAIRPSAKESYHTGPHLQFGTFAILIKYPINKSAYSR